MYYQNVYNKEIYIKAAKEIFKNGNFAQYFSCQDNLKIGYYVGHYEAGD